MNDEYQKQIKNSVARNRKQNCVVKAHVLLVLDLDELGGKRKEQNLVGTRWVASPILPDIAFIYNKYTEFK